jgi:hypothetical protein
MSRRGPSDAVSVKVDGLTDFRKELKKLEDEGQFLSDLKEANFEVASMVVDRARAFASTRQQRKAAESLKAGRGAARATISGGGARYPFFAGAEFGSIQFTQFPEWRGSSYDAGHFLYPTIRQSSDDIVELYGDAIEKITGRAFPD